ncbi:CDP-diacylglycerol/serineO-phosphatidyltransfera se [Caldithrix abyssi DSM 13497]|uniref:CDP-diacylglycerol--serine O-phosphatidyltransferase n=1 Tax=Caldithrix abyssi DSM 13497 TaxID=880073 RepID=H1XQQ7_CALAY|nr:CDP-diacylglycerol--serine O-phosphatidyltransferase [Caldithrix abyssi]APF18316.1 CDP-diacylglycerol--serine O-phosphatidyltransferase [Caldithrix abyssi DSM 13497]EHO42330.1 CDP-diacylglycerol/serineO-phosphatidyltransfera se [Caldithrix abyssi DSM 13497]
MIKVPRTIVPSFFTIGNMFIGFMAVIYAVRNENVVLSSWLILLCAFLDAMDGRVARFAQASSRFGVEYDSLADVISFGMAPSVLIYLFFFNQWGNVGLFISFFPLLFASIRLARFNVELEGFEKTAFTGLPSPAAAITIASYLIFVNTFFPGEHFPRILLILTILVSVLMVSTIRYEVVPRMTLKGSLGQKLGVLLVVVVVISLLIEPHALLLPYSVLYVLSGMVRFMFRLSQGKRLGGKKA